MGVWPSALLAADRVILSAFAVPTIYRPLTQAAVTVSGIFDSAFQRLDVGDGVSSVTPMVFYRVDDLPVSPESDGLEIEIDGATYAVNEARPDGQGGVEVMLMRRW